MSRSLLVLVASNAMHLSDALSKLDPETLAGAEVIEDTPENRKTYGLTEGVVGWAQGLDLKACLDCPVIDPGKANTKLWAQLSPMEQNLPVHIRKRHLR